MGVLSLLGPLDPSFRALSGRLRCTVRRQKFDKDSLSTSPGAGDLHASVLTPTALWACFLLYCAGLILGDPKVNCTLNVNRALTFNPALNVNSALKVNLWDALGRRRADRRSTCRLRAPLLRALDQRSCADHNLSCAEHSVLLCGKWPVVWLWSARVDAPPGKPSTQCSTGEASAGYAPHTWLS